MHVRREHHAWLEPLVLSWDAEGATLGERLGWQGTRDPAAFLTVPAAIRFQAEHGWDEIRARCHELADRVRVEIGGAAPLSGPDGFVQMVAVELPPCDPGEIERRLRDEHRIEAVVRPWNGRPLLRVSVQAYNEDADVEALLAAVRLLV